MRIKELFLQEGIALDENQERLFEQYRSLLLEYNEKFNLTAITDEDEIIVKHFIDSAKGLKFFHDNALVVDIGSGAGFPAIPLKILNPTLRFTLLDAVNKRVNFLNVVTEKLNLKEVECLHERAEEHVVKARAKYDFAVARAVAGLPTLLEYSLPLLKAGGKFIAYKGETPEEEISAARVALEVLGGKAITVEKFKLMGEHNRSFIVVEKVKETPVKYPRGQNKPKNNPL
ncbi:MAG TPA: 16S rRNA (guanine(527)-N(7))-methyltransferase RsmG [Clostridia bacterium]|jgi:16S rRNA (guanine527-N7)-methyltransferase|nr:16S rRNA (guanine(527)-N(7))-methyltransferase RsmG [Clostridia bacterium]